MRSLRTWFVLLALAFLAPGPLAYAQGTEPADKQKQPAPTGATKEEVEQLRREVAAQRQTIEALKAMVQRLVEVSQPGAGVARLVPASAVQPVNAAGSVELARADKQAAAKRAGETGLQTGWNGEHFFLKSADGNFQIQPYGYVQLDYRLYQRSLTPANTFAIRRGRFGFQGNLGKHYEFAILADFADSTSTLVRDAYVNIKYLPEFQFQFGQFKEPFSQEVLTGAPYLDFVERSLVVNVMPSPTSFRSPGVMVHGQLFGGAVQYQAGAFNGKGTLANNTTGEPEGVWRLRFYPWRHSSNEWLQGFAFGGAFTHGRAKGLSSEVSASGLLPDRSFTFFPSLPIKGTVIRANGELTWIKGPMAVRAEYDQTNQSRRALGSGSADLPGVVFKGYYATATYLLTGEKRPENGQPKPLHPFLAAEGGQGIGAWELKFRYSNLQAIALCSLPVCSTQTGAARTTQENRVDEFSVGINWYPSYFVRYMLDFNVDRVKNPAIANPVVRPPQRSLAVLQRLQFRF